MSTELEKAAAICKQVAEDRARWGKHGGFNMYSEQQVLDALVALGQHDVFDQADERAARIAANRAKGAAEARAVKFKHKMQTLEAKLELANETIQELKNELGR